MATMLMLSLLIVLASGCVTATELGCHDGLVVTGARNDSLNGDWEGTGSDGEGRTDYTQIGQKHPVLSNYFTINYLT